MAYSETLKGIAMTLRMIAKRPDPAESARTLQVLARRLEEMAGKETRECEAGTTSLQN